MAIVISLTDGTTTVTLTTSPWLVAEYSPLAPDPTKPTEPITETLTLVCVGSSATVQSNVTGVTRLLDAAHRRTVTKLGAKIYLQMQLDGESASWRSLVRRGVIDLGEGGLDQLRRGVAELRMTIEREPWWEGARTQLTLTNLAGSNNTSGLATYNRNDGTYSSYVEIDAAEVTGDLPAPLELRMASPANSRFYGNFFVSVNAFDATVGYTLEGESVQAGGSTVADATCSNGNKQRWSTTGAGTITARWTLSSANLSKFAGRPAMVLANFKAFTYGATTPIYCVASITDTDGVLLLASAAEMTLKTADDYLQPLGVLYLPPGGYSTAWDAMALTLVMRTSQTETIDLDYIQLLPAERGRYRQIVQRGMSLDTGDEVVDNGTDEMVYVEASAIRLPYYEQRGEVLTLLPNKTQRVIIQHDGVGMTADWYLNVKAWYRPRRMAI